MTCGRALVLHDMNLWMSLFKDSQWGWVVGGGWGVRAGQCLSCTGLTGDGCSGSLTFRPSVLYLEPIPVTKLRRQDEPVWELWIENCWIIIRKVSTFGEHNCIVQRVTSKKLTTPMSDSLLSVKVKHTNANFRLHDYHSWQISLQSTLRNLLTCDWDSQLF